MGNQSSKASCKTQETENEPLRGNQKTKPKETSAPPPSTNYHTIQSAKKGENSHGVPHAPSVEGFGFWETCFVSLSHRTCTLVVGAALGLLLVGFNMNLIHSMERISAQNVISMLIAVFGFVACVLLAIGGVYGCLQAHRIAWWKALAPGILFQFAFLLLLVGSPKVDVSDEIQSNANVPDIVPSSN